jgi:hypothetical protein
VVKQCINEIVDTDAEAETGESNEMQVRGQVWEQEQVQRKVTKFVRDSGGSQKRTLGVMCECREQRAESREQRAESREQRAASREQRTECREQRAESDFRFIPLELSTSYLILHTSYLIPHIGILFFTPILILPILILTRLC